MRQNRLLIILLPFTAILFMSILFGCSPKVTEETAKPDTINISYSYKPINVPTIVAINKKSFEQEFAKMDVKVEWHELEGPATTEALAAGSIDVATSLNYVSAILSKANGNDIKIIASYSKFPKGIGLVVGKDSNIKTIADLKGKKIALQKGTMLHEMLVKILQEANIAASDVEIVGMPSNDAATSLMQKHVDAAILPEPILTKVSSANKASVLATGESYILGQSVIAARTDFLKKYPQIAQKVLQLHQDTLVWSREHEQESLEISAQTTQLELKTAQTLYKTFQFDMEITEDNILKLKEAAEFLQANGFIKNKEAEIDQLINDLVDLDYLPKMPKN